MARDSKVFSFKVADGTSSSRENKLELKKYQLIVEKSFNAFWFTVTSAISWDLLLQQLWALLLCQFFPVETATIGSMRR
jgi:hypothetical protein